MVKLIQVSDDALFVFSDLTQETIENLKRTWTNNKLISNNEPTMIIASKIEVIDNG